jgi:ERCC4-type nuclease
MIDIYIDTREQKPLEFTAEYISNVYTNKLPYGDYGAKYEGARVPVVFERKSLPDLCGTLGKGYTRFKKELLRAKEDNVLLIIIIEVDLLKILKGYKRSKMSGIGMIRTLFTLMTKYKVPFITCKNRKEMSLYISEFFYSYVKNIGDIDAS